MRYPLAKVLRQRLTRQLRRALPQFRERKARSGVRGTFLWEWRATPELTCYVALAVDDERDRFTIELAWSRTHHFPAQLRAHTADERPRAGAMRFHLRALWQPYRLEPSWALGERTPHDMEVEHALIDPGVSAAHKVALIEGEERRRRASVSEPGGVAAPDEGTVTEALARVGSAVADVVARLERYAVPYFAGVIEQHGGTGSAAAGGRPAAASYDYRIEELRRAGGV